MRGFLLNGSIGLDNIGANHMDFYQRMERLSATKITKYQRSGVNLVYTETIPGEHEYDMPTTVTTLTPIDAVVQGAGDDWADGETILRTDLQIQIAAVDHTPMVGDKVQVNGKPLTIQAIESIPGAGDPVSYIMFARG